MKTYLKKFPQAALDAFAKSIADEVSRAAGEPCGYAAREKPQFERVEFSFLVAGSKYSFPFLSSQQMIAAFDESTHYEQLVTKVLTDTSPRGLAKRIWEQTKQREFQPEIPVFVDQHGRRHHTLKAETGFLSSVIKPVTFKRSGNEHKA